VFPQATLWADWHVNSTHCSSPDASLSKDSFLNVHTFKRIEAFHALFSKDLFAEMTRVEAANKKKGFLLKTPFHLHRGN